MLARRFGIRAFSQSAIAFKKSKAGKAAKETPSPEPVADVKTFDANALKEQLEKSKSLFAEKIKEAKAGALNQKSFFQLPVEVGNDTEQPLGEIATIASRGSKLNIVAFDPKMVKHIRTAIVSKLNIPAQESNTDKQTLSVTLDGDSGSKKDQIRQQLKQEFDHFKTSASRFSLSSIRAKQLNSIKKLKGTQSEAESRKQAKQIEDLIKKYQGEFSEMLKKAEA